MFERRDEKTSLLSQDASRAHIMALDEGVLCLSETMTDPTGVTASAVTNQTDVWMSAPMSVPFLPGYWRGRLLLHRSSIISSLILYVLSLGAYWDCLHPFLISCKTEEVLERCQNSQPKQGLGEFR